MKNPFLPLRRGLLFVATALLFASTTQRAGAVPVTSVVKNTNDSGADSLRQVVHDLPAGGTVTFSDGTGGTTNFYDATADKITLTSGEIAIAKSLTIAGPGADKLTVSGGDLTRVFSVASANAIAVDISGLTVTAGYAPKEVSTLDAKGGGIVINEAASLNLTDCAVTSCLAEGQTGAGWGGGLAHLGTGTVALRGCTFSGNIARHGSTGIAGIGGAIARLGSGPLHLVNCTLSGNTAEGTLKAFGGGIYAQSAAACVIKHCTITDNTASASPDAFGGGVNALGASPLEFRNSIVAGNTSLGNSPDFVGTPTVNAFSIIPNAPLPGLLLAPLENNGGATKTHALLTGSPAIDAGDPDFDPADFTPALTTDQRGTGFSRVLHGSSQAIPPRVDIGAFEARSSLVTDDVAFFNGKKAIEIDALANDVPGGMLTAIFSRPQYGTAFIVNGKIHYEATGPLPPRGDAFTYTYRNGQGGIGRATVTLVNFATIAGNYDGLIAPGGNATDQQGHDRSGYLRITVAKTGTFSGAIIFAGSKLNPIFRQGFRGYGFNSRFGVDGGAVRILLRRPSAPLTLTLRYDAANHLVQGTVDSIDSDALAFTSSLALAAQAPAGALAGGYLLHVPAGLAPNPKAGALITPLGAVRLIGRLGDGAPFSSASALHADESFAIYAGLYAGPASLLGSVRGTLQFPLVPSPTGDAMGSLEWFKPPRPRDRTFPLGFDVISSATLQR